MFKKIVVLSFMVLFLFCVSCSMEDTDVTEKQKVEMQVKDLKKKMDALVAKIEKNPEAEQAGNWREQMQEYKAALARLTGKEIEKSRKRFSEIETGIEQSTKRLHELEMKFEAAKEAGKEKVLQELEGAMKKEREVLHKLKVMLERRRAGERERPGVNLEFLHATVQELGILLEQDPDNERTERRKALYQYWNKLLAEYQANRPKKQTREQKMKQAEGAIKELTAAIEQNPESENVEKWKGQLKEYQGLVEWLKKTEGMTEAEVGIMQSEAQLKELNAYLKQLEDKGDQLEEVQEVKQRIKKVEARLAEIKAYMKKKEAEK